MASPGSSPAAGSIRRRSRQPSFGGGQHAGATLFLLPLFGYSVISQPPASWGGWNVWLSLLGLGLVCTALAYIVYFRLLSSVGPVKSMTTTFLIPPFGVLWGALLLDEPLSMAHMYGGVLIAAALWLVLKPAVVKVRGDCQVMR